MIEINIDQHVAHHLRVCITQQNNDIELQYCHLCHKDYVSVLKNFDLYKSDFQHWYKSLISGTIKKYISSERVVVSMIPAIICYFPGLYCYHTISHPICKNSYSIFFPLTRWTEANTIRTSHQNTAKPIGHKIDMCNMIFDHETIIIPQHNNTSNNTCLGLFFYVMSYQNYKTSIIYSSKTIGDYFNLL